MGNGGKILAEHYPLQEQSRHCITTKKEKNQQRIGLATVNWKELFALQNQVQYP